MQFLVRKLKFVYQRRWVVKPVMAQALKNEHLRQLVPPVVVQVRCVCNKAFLRYSRPARNAEVKVSRFLILAAIVMVRVVNRRRKHCRLKYLPVLILATGFD